MSAGVVRYSSRSAAPFPCVYVVAVIDVEKLLCMVLRIDDRDFPEIVPAHVSGIVFSTMGEWIALNGARRWRVPGGPAGPPYQDRRTSLGAQENGRSVSWNGEKRFAKPLRSSTDLEL